MTTSTKSPARESIRRPLTRRSFLKTTAGMSLLATTGGGPLFSRFALAAPPEGNPTTLGKWVASTCQGCTTWCPVEVFIQDGRAVKVRGNQNSKTNPGTVCPKGHMIPKLIYDPDRIKVPMKRTNPVKGKGVDPQFVPITWEEALGTVARELQRVKDQYGPTSFSLWTTSAQ